MFEATPWRQMKPLDRYFFNYQQSGKSYTLIQILQHLSKLVVAPTLTAVSRLKQEAVDAHTIDSVLTVAVDGFTKEKFRGKGAFPFEALLLDEAYNTSQYHQQLIYNIWVRNPGVKIFFFGDKGQCLPVEVRDDKNSNGVVIDYDVSLAWQQMLRNRVQLPYNAKTGRYDKKLYREVRKLDANALPVIQTYEPSNTEINRFLAKTNRCVDATNMKLMNVKTEFDEFALPVNKGRSKSKLTSMKLSTGLGDPVIMYTSSKVHGFHNNQQFCYIGSKNDQISLQLRARTEN